MKVRKKVILALSFATVLVGASTASATYSWYQLNLSRTMTIHGTFLQQSSGLEIGFYYDQDLFELNQGLKDSLEEDKTASYPGLHLYFPKENEEEEDGNKDRRIGPDLVRSVLSTEGFASDVIYPLTSGEYRTGTSLHKDENGSYTPEANLLLPPEHYCTFNDFHKKAEKKYYIHLGLCFRIKEGKSRNRNIYLSEYAFTADKARESLRVYMESSRTELASIFKPAAGTREENNFTYVGGHLDLNQDGIYEHRGQTVDGISDDYEVFYGQLKDGYSLKDVYSKNENGEYQRYTDNVSPSPTPNYNCFTASGHEMNTIPLRSDYLNYTATAEYQSLESYRAQKDEYGHFTNVSPVSQTDENGIGFLDVDMYLEGWDPSNINTVIGDQIGSSFSFAIE